MLIHQLRRNTNIRQAKAGQCCKVTIGLCIQAGGNQINDFDLTVLPGPGLEQLLFTRLYRAGFKLPLNNLQPFINLFLVGACAVPPQQKLHHVGRHRKLAAEGSHQVFTHQVAIQCGYRFVINLIQHHHTSPPPILVSVWATRAPLSSSNTTTAFWPSMSSSSTTTDALPSSFNGLVLSTTLLDASPARVRMSSFRPLC